MKSWLSLSTRPHWKIGLLVFCVAVFLAVCLWRIFKPREGIERFAYPKSTEIAGGRVEVPMILDKGLPFLEVRVNNAGPFLFLVDTGTEIGSLSKDLAEELALPAVRARVRARNAAGLVSRPRTAHYIESLSIGGAEFQGFANSADDYSHFRGTPLGGIKGILGMAMFRDCLLTLDFPGRRVVLQRGRLTGLDAGETLPLLDPRPEQAAVPAEVATKEVRLTLDSGSTGGISLPRTEARGLPFLRPPDESVSPLFGLLVNRRRANLNGSAWLACYELVNPPVSWIVEYPGLGLVGMEILQHFSLTFDLRGRTVLLSRDSDLPIPFAANRSTGLVFATNRSQTWIHTIKPDTPAAGVDLRVGDKVLAVNGRPFLAMSQDGFLLVPETEDSVMLKVRRKDATFEVEVPLTSVPK